MAQIALREVSKRFGDVVAIRDLSLEILDREFLVLLGPSGAGKTTTLRTVAGLERPDGGLVQINGESMEGRTPAERNVAFVFQDYALYPFMTAYQNMAFPLKARPTSKEEIDQRVRSVARVLQIEHLLQRKPAQLSGGEQQRVALGRAIVRRPQAFLMDEPLTNLDAKLRAQMRADLKHIHADIGATTLYVTHDQVEAMTMGDRIAVLRAGAVQQVGTPDDIYLRPANAFVAGFVGNPNMNLLEGEIVLPGGDGHAGTDRGTPSPVPAVHLARGAGLVPLAGPLAPLAAAAPAPQVLLGIRPENIRIVSESEPNALRTTVYAVEPLGDRYIYDLQLGEYVIKVKTSPTRGFETGQPVWVQFEPARVHLFDRATQNRIGGTTHG